MLMPMPTDEQVTAGNPDDDPATVLGGRDYGATLWEPSEQSVREARITDYLAWLRDTAGQNLVGYDELWRWSVAELEEFWASVWDYFGVLGRRGDGPVLAGGPMPDVRWFGGTTLNYARNALRLAQTHPDQTAVIFRSEAGRSGTLSYAELAAEVGRVREGLRALGVTAGDRVAAFAPNIPEALVGLLATASLGAIWSSCSPDFGAHSVIDRLAQISPKVLIAVDGYPYGGKWFDRRQQVADIVAELPSLETLITVDYGAVAAGAGATAAGEGWAGAAMEGAGEGGSGEGRGGGWGAGSEGWGERAAALAGRVRDLTEFLVELGPVAPRHPLPATVAYHDACHLAHAQKITAPPRELLTSIPGLRLADIADGGVCCGSAGIYNLVQPEAARELGQRKAEAVAAAGADLLVSGNPGCAMQIASALAARGLRLPMRHTAEVLDASIRGADISTLLT